MKILNLKKNSEIYNTLSTYFPSKIDKSFYNTLTNFNRLFSMKNNDHLGFLASNHIGVYTFKWSSLDDDKFYNTFNIDPNELENRILSTPGINKEFKVASNKHYLYLVYLMTSTLHSDNNDKLKNDILLELYRTLSYRMISGRITHFFSYNIEESIGHALAEQMTDKYILKKLGSWAKVIDNKAKDVMEHGYHFKRVCECSTEDIQLVVVDTYNKYNSMIKNMFSLLVDILNSKSLINQTSSFSESEDGESEYSVSNSYVKNTITYVNTRIGSKDLLNSDMIKLVANKCNIEYNLLEESLLKFNVIKNHTELVSNIVSMSMSFLDRKNITHDYKRNIFKIITLLRNFYMATSIRTDDMVSVRNKLEDFVNKNIQGKGRSFNKNLSTAIFVYITSIGFYI